MKISKKGIFDDKGKLIIPVNGKIEIIYKKEKCKCCGQERYKVLKYKAG